MQQKSVWMTVLFVGVMGALLTNPVSGDFTRYKGFYGTLLLYDSTGNCTGHTVADGGHTIQYRVDSGNWTDCTTTAANGNYQYTPSDSGRHLIYVRAKPQCSDSIHHHQPCSSDGFSYPFSSQSINNYNFGTTIRTYPCPKQPDRWPPRLPGTQ